VQLLTDLLSHGNNHTLKLFKNDVTPAESDTAATYTECDFTGYGAKTLTRSVSAGTWSTPSTTDGTTSSRYNASTPQQFGCTGSTGNTVYGYYVIDVTTTVLCWAERFATARNMAENDTLSMTPKLELA
jgi:hypothetical protein